MENETEIDFNALVFNHKAQELDEALGIDFSEVDLLFEREVLPIVEEISTAHEITGETTKKSIIVEAIWKANIPLKVKIFMLVGLEQAIS